MQVPQAEEPFEGQGQRHQQPVNEEAVGVVVGHVGDPITGLEDWQRRLPPSALTTVSSSVAQTMAGESSEMSPTLSLG